MTLFDECIKTLGTNILVLSAEESQQVTDLVQQHFTFAKWGRIDWENARQHKKITSLGAIELSLLIGQQKSHKCYIFWDDGELPVVQTSIENISSVIDNVTSVSFDTWIYCPALGFIIEFYHDGEITIGWMNTSPKA